MRVLMISDVYFPRINGVSTSIETFRNDLAAQQIHTTLVAPAYPQARERADIHRVPARQLPFDPEDRLMHWNQLRQATDRLAAEQADVIHVQTPFAAHYAGIHAARRHGLPVVATYHTHFEEYFHHYLPLAPKALLKRVARHIARQQCNQLDAVVVPSRAMRDALGDYGVTAPMHILPTGIPVGQFEGGDGPAFRQRHDIPAERKVALYVGRVAHEKNIGFLLDALTRAIRLRPDLMLVIAGEGPALPTLKREARQLGLTNHTRFVGYLDRTRDLPSCYACADVFVFSSRTETQGLVLLEAMAAGVPVYAFAAMGTCDIIEPCRGALPAPQDAAEFAAGLADLVGDAPRLASMSREGRRFATEWSAPERARQLANLYRSLS
ncbi:MAG: glycosyltransferase family 4 protein, partial [Rhodocyclaceae bacterium]|nr:glycosyltransferase family 4 protein [Rhodocyclaceae bacterium]